jgi:hypothetical protein
VGVWGTDLFSDDLACDIRDHYRELLEDGMEDGAATRLILEKFRAYLEEPKESRCSPLLSRSQSSVDSTLTSVIELWPYSTAVPTSRCGSAKIRNFFRSATRCSKKPAHS